jgi:hypothetical protein
MIFIELLIDLLTSLSNLFARLANEVERLAWGDEDEYVSY